MEAEKEGWKCPQCEKIWAPSVKSCEDCKVQESKDQDKRQLLTETDDGAWYFEH